MRRIGTVAAAIALTFCSAASGQKPLPEGHPPIDGTKPALPPGHPPMGDGAPLPKDHPPMDELRALVDKASELKGREKSFEVAAALGKLAYFQGKYEAAASALSEAIAQAEKARGLFVNLRRKVKAPAGACPSPAGELEQLHQAAVKHSQVGEHEAALACSKASLDGLSEVYLLRAQALFLLGRHQEALAAHDAALAVFPDAPDHLYARAFVTFDSKGDQVPSLKDAREGFTRFVSVAPSDRRASVAQRMIARTNQAIAAGGVTRLAQAQSKERDAKLAEDRRAPAPSAQPSSPPPLTREMVEAVENTERTPELKAGLAKLVDEGEEHLARGRFQEALDAYKRVVPFEPENGRAKAGMAWSLVGLNRQPMADRVWSVAVSAAPKAVDQLGETLKQKGDAKGAKALWKKLAETAPSYAQSAGLSKKL